LEDRQAAMDEFVKKCVPESLRSRLKISIEEKKAKKTGEEVMAFAKKGNHDLIVIGAKGHSKVALLLLGSVTERVLSLTKEVPVLIVK
ncbi:MAG: universal stress protein, partial [Bacteroidota bacterium]